jgi:DNA-binding response OmpR family regulator
MKVLIVAARDDVRDLMRLAVRSIERRVGEPVEFLEAPNGERGRAVALRHRPEAVVADEFASREGAFSLARSLRGDVAPYAGAIVILLDREQDRWLARWSGADAWFVKPVDPFALADELVELLARRPQEESA